MKYYGNYLFICLFLIKVSNDEIFYLRKSAEGDK
jgi:hypothetical protein